MTMNQVVFGLSWGSIRPPLWNASSAITPRASEWMTWPWTPTLPTGPSGRRLPTPNRRISIGSTAWKRSTRLAALAAPAHVPLADRRRWPRLAGASQVALPGELVLVCLEERRVAAEACPGHREQPAEQDHQDHSEIEREDRADDQQEEGDQPGPEDP